jgi:hypothetical protein
MKLMPITLSRGRRTGRGAEGGEAGRMDRCDARCMLQCTGGAGSKLSTGIARPNLSAQLPQWLSFPPNR